jgi:hypothetical protein
MVYSSSLLKKEERKMDDDYRVRFLDKVLKEYLEIQQEMSERVKDGDMDYWEWIQANKRMLEESRETVDCFCHGMFRALKDMEEIHLMRVNNS